MLSELQKYLICGSFDYCPIDHLSRVCNAPTNQAGIYIVYANRDKQYRLVYIGISGQVNKEGIFKVRKDGLWGRLVKGKRDGELRKDFWLRQMMKENLDALKIFWYVTCTPEGIGDVPSSIERQLIKN